MKHSTQNGYFYLISSCRFGNYVTEQPGHLYIALTFSFTQNGIKISMELSGERKNLTAHLNVWRQSDSKLCFVLTMFIGHIWRNLTDMLIFRVHDQLHDSVSLLTFELSSFHAPLLFYWFFEIFRFYGYASVHLISQMRQMTFGHTYPIHMQSNRFLCVQSLDGHCTKIFCIPAVLCKEKRLFFHRNIVQTVSTFGWKWLSK